MWAKLDANKDGRISRDEAKADSKFAARFDQMDINKDGFVDRADREQRMQQHRDAWFAKADTDKDGKLSKAEFDAASKLRGEHGPRVNTASVASMASARCRPSRRPVTDR